MNFNSFIILYTIKYFNYYFALLIILACFITYIIETVLTHFVFYIKYLLLGNLLFLILTDKEFNKCVFNLCINRLLFP